MRGVRWIHCLTALGKTRIKLIQKQEKWLPGLEALQRGCVSWRNTFKIALLLRLETTWVFTSTDNKYSIIIRLWALKVTLHLQESFIAAPKELTTLSIVPDYQEHCKNSSCIAEHSQFSRPNFLRVLVLSFLPQIETEGWTTCEQGFKCIIEGCCFSAYW